MNKQNQIICLIIGSVFLFALLFYYYTQPVPFLSDIQYVRNYIESFGIFAPLALIILQVIQIVIPPVPNIVIGVAGGFIFGTFKGFVYNTIGLIIGSVIVFFLTRKLGRPLVERFVKKEYIEKYDKVLGKNWVTLLLLYIVFPLPDALVYIAGLSNMTFLIFLVATVLFRAPQAILLAYIGDGIAFKNTITFWIFVVSAILSVIIFIYKNKLEEFSDKLVNKVRNVNQKIP